MEENMSQGNIMKSTKQSPSSSSSQASRDLISSLSDPVLHHIFSFLDMKEVMQTSVLAKRWRYLWKSLPFLSFDHEIFLKCLESCSITYSHCNFADFVHRVLLLRDSSPIESFRITCEKGEGHVKTSDLDTFIRFVISRNVKEIDIKVFPRFGHIEFPNCLFNCKSLTTLKLNLGKYASEDVVFYGHAGIEYLVLVRPPISLPALKTLHLRSIYLYCGGTFAALLSNCPALESLFIDYCTFHRVFRFDICCPQLKHLHINMLFEAIDNDVFKIKLSAPNLLTFKCTEFWSNQYYFKNFSSLLTAEIEDMESFKFDYKKLTRFVRQTIKCLRAFRNVENLTLSETFIQILSESSAIGRSKIQFPNLTYLRLRLKPWNCKCFSGLLYLLEKSVNLETLVIENAMRGVDVDVESSSLELNHLRSIELISEEHEEEIVKELLNSPGARNARIVVQKSTADQ